MPRRPIRDWLSTDEAAAFIGVSVQRFRDFMVPYILPHSELLPMGWLHYKGDLEKLKAEREANPPKGGRRKFNTARSKKPRRKEEQDENAVGNGPE